MNRTWSPVACASVLAWALLSPGKPAIAQEPAEEPPAPTIAIAEEMDGPFFVTWTSANVRTRPDGTAPIIVNLPFGSQIFVTGRIEGAPWYRVEAPDGQVGYVWDQVVAPAVVAVPGTDGGAAAPGVSPDDAVDDNSAAMARDLGVLGATPVVREGTVGPDDPRDFFRFTVPDWSELSITLTGMQADADIALLDENGEHLADSVLAGSAPEEIGFLAAAGTYYIQVYVYEGETPYVLTASATPSSPPPEDSAGDTPDTARALGDLTGGEATVEEWVGHSDAVDFLSFNVTERSRLEITMTGMQADADITLEDDFGSVLASSVEAGAADEFMSVDVEPGTYYLRVVPYTSNTPYVVSIRASDAPPIPQDRAGDDAASALVIAPLSVEPQVFTDWVGPGDLNDYYRFDVTEPGQLLLVLDGLRADADVEVLDAESQGMLATSTLAGTEGEQLSLAVEPGSYLVRVYVFSGSTDYRLELRAAP